MKKQLIFTLISFIIISSCKKQGDDVLAISEFPNEIGNHWRYEYKPDNGPTTYIDVDIIGTRLLPGGQLAKIWVYKINNFTDTNFVVFEDPIATMYWQYNFGGTAPLYFAKMRYIFPLQTGNVWLAHIDSIRVLNNSTLTVPAGTFENTFELSKKGSGPNRYVRDTIWFTPQVGMTKLKQIEYDLGPAFWGNGIWELLEYSLK